MWVADYTQRDNVGVCAPVATTSCNFNESPAFNSNPLGLASDGVYMWMTNHGADSVTKWMSPSPLVAVAVSTYPAGTAPYRIAFDGANIWVANEGSGTVTELSAATGAPLGTFTVRRVPAC